MLTIACSRPSKTVSQATDSAFWPWHLLGSDLVLQGSPNAVPTNVHSTCRAMCSLPFGSMCYSTWSCCIQRFSASSCPLQRLLRRFSAWRYPLQRCLATGIIQMQNLKALSKSSARFASFAVVLCDGEIVNYTYTQKNTRSA